MTGYIGCFGIVGIAVFIVLLFLRRKKIESEMNEFYKENSLYTTENAPPNVRESLGASDNLYCCRANLTLATGANIEFCWWEWYLKSTTVVNNAPATSFDYRLAVSFAPGTVSDEFIQKAIRWADKSGGDAAQKVKDFFVLNTETPYRAEKLADGSLLICWQILKRRDVYDAKINWLKQNVAIRVTPEIALLEEIHALLPVEPKTVEPKIIEITPVEPQIAGTVFYRHDNYAAIRVTFNSRWPNLQLELHHNSGKFDKEGYDEMESDAGFADPGTPNAEVLTLTDETWAGEAEKLFEQCFGGRARILRDGVSVERHESLAYCNNPFR